ncbi:alpha-L-fucosidase [Novipirellula artificiosorum]|uniref:alpha-L-fucosidase n=1 Tax=Novipirellula artificiosorum TaxID=2528016 RepID=A0A5C6DCR4_9BACT|nr:alpha-L-fucosidase [Novipirellula artificiosorum]TWU35023.1 Alpha-L-fucosidase [Novipirellula artificiosorum]
MKNAAFLKTLSLWMLMNGFAACSAQSLASEPTPNNLDASSTQETSQQRDARMKWWRDARFGMFVHWGLYSGLAGTWDGKPVGTRGGMEWIQQRVKADTNAYAEQAIPKFKPSEIFAAQWAKLAKNAGCKYLVFTTKHHDGFGLHDSKAGDFNAGHVLNRDLVREIVEACRSEGLKVGFYHSVIDWHHDQYTYAESKQLPHPLKGQPYPNGLRDHAKYQDYLHTQVDELLSNYGPVDVLWWDYSSQDFQGDEAWRANELMQLARARQPGIIMNNRLFRTPEAGWSGMGTAGFIAQLDSQYGDFITPEQHIPSTGMPGIDWETCMTMNTTWGFSDHDDAWKSDQTLIRNLVDIASKGGNYLLNIGPKGDGSIPQQSIDALQSIGKWMQINGEAIHGTTASPFATLPFDGRCTSKPGKLYLHLFDRPNDGRLLLPMTNPIRKAYLLSDPETTLSISVINTDNGQTIRLPDTEVNPLPAVVVAEIAGDVEVIVP